MPSNRVSMKEQLMMPTCKQRITNRWYTLIRAFQIIYQDPRSSNGETIQRSSIQSPNVDQLEEQFTLWLLWTY